MQPLNTMEVLSGRETQAYVMLKRDYLQNPELPASRLSLPPEAGEIPTPGPSRLLLP